MATDDKCKTCAASAGCSGEPGPECGEEKSLAGSLNDIKNVIAVMSGKGGVGKSSVAALLAAGLARQGYKVGLLDADITGPSIPRAFGIASGTRLQGTVFGLVPPTSKGGVKVMSINLLLPSEDDPVVWRGPLLAGAVKQFWNEVDWRDLDYLVVDMPPGTGDVPLTVLQSLPVTGLLLVTSPQDLVLMVVKKTFKMARKMNVTILGLVENMTAAICPHCGERIELFGAAQGADASSSLGIPLLAQLPWDPRLNEYMDQGRIEEYESAELVTLLENLEKQFAHTKN
ncbi:MAG: Mrp/NBP35 family ATP-binding protein [Syntrophomonadaceae bacterium]|nr:Mrp/NBP35 family ATP-binding protein [Syntrophomonadaceae bacterium]